MAVAWILVTGMAAWGADPLGSGFTYQGRLELNGVPMDNPSPGCEFRFSLFEDAGGITQVGGTQTITGVPVVNGLFIVELNSGSEFGPTAFIGDERWLEIAVKCPPDVDFTTLSPRQKLSATPFAHFALNAAGANTWKLTGNVGTTAGTHFLGTTDDEPLELHVNGARVLRIEPDVLVPFFTFDVSAPNVLGGSHLNTITPAVAGATIAGGGAEDVDGPFTLPNRVTDDFGAVGGGGGNQAGDDAGTTGDRRFATVAGGYRNTATATYATVGGGNFNTASNAAATVGGGDSNVASGLAATVCGGAGNTASGQYSFAAGLRANANHDGAFVWGDRTSADFVSTGVDQFLIRASGGVGIGTNSPTNQLTVSGDSDFTGNVGVGTASPEQLLHVKDGDAGIAPNSNSRLVVERDNSTFINILTPSTAQTGILFGNPADGSAAGGVVYNSSNSPDGMQFRVNGNSAKMTILADGDVGIGTTSPAGGFRLDVIGNIRCTALTETSTRALKENILPIDGALEKVSRLQGVQFNWSAEHGGQSDLGFVAEDVAEVLPELVTWEEEGVRAGGLKYGHLSAVAVEAIKELHAEVLAKEAEIKALREEKDAQIADLTARLVRIEKMMGANTPLRKDLK